MKRLWFVSAMVALIFGVLGAGNVSAQKRFIWNGEWNVPSRFTGSTLTIKQLSTTKFKFTLEASNGANSGEVSGVAVIKGNNAYFDDRKSGKKDDDVYGCKLTFKFKGKMIDVDMNNECQSYAGLGVYFANYYYKGKQKPIESNFVVLEVFPNLATDNKFKALVGKDYERFLDSFHQIYPEDDLDGFGAKVFSACVRGNCPWDTSIIMFDKKGNFWAAFIHADTDDLEKPLVRYFTNSAEWTDKLPKTLEKWVSEKRQSNENLTVVYKNKK